MTGSVKRRGCAVLTTATLVATLAACAPEPVAEMPSGKPSTTAEQEPSWPESGNEVAPEKQVVLPSSFPSDRLPLFDVQINDAGESETGWFVVLNVASLETASARIDQIAADGDFAITEEAPTPDGGRSTLLTNESLEVAALSLVDEDGNVLLNLDVTDLLG